MPRRVRYRASRAHPASALRQEQGRHPDRQPHGRPAHHQGRTTGRTCRRICARSISPLSKWSITSSSIQNATPLEEPRRSSSPTISPRATSTPPPACRRRPQEEVDVVQAYGGEMIFTPGDIVYSSSKLIELAPPQLQHRKAAAADGARRHHLRRSARRRSTLMADSVCMSSATPSSTATPTARMIGGQTKTPTMSVLFEQQVDYVGGAGDRCRSICARPAPR